MKKHELIRRLEALYKNEPTPRWLMEPWEDDYLPCAAGRRVVLVSPEATAYLLQNICGKHSKSATFIHVEPEGDIRRGPIKKFEDWALAVKISLDEGNYIYNARTKKCSRPTWHPKTEKRTFENMMFEAVRLVADPKAYDANVKRVNTRLFVIGDM